MLTFRNVDASPDDPVETWPLQALQIALEQGHLGDWRRIVDAIRVDPWGRVARDIEYVLGYARPYGTADLIENAIRRARRRADTADRATVAERMRAATAASGLSQAAFAERIGTSASRLSTYLSGKVTPSAALLVRAERVAAVEAANAGRVGEWGQPSSSG